MRNLVLVLGDQLDHRSTAFSGFDPSRDAVWMAEVQEEATHVWCHKLRIAFFFSAMRHFRTELSKRGCEVHYHELTADPSRDRGRNFAEVLRDSVRDLRPEKLILMSPGDYRVLSSIRKEADALGLKLDLRPDKHFYCDIDEFRDYAGGKKELRLELFYRHMRKKHAVLLEDHGAPVGGKWNFDAENRHSFGQRGPGRVPRPIGFHPDRMTAEVVRMVQTRFWEHPGSLDHFELPVTRGQAQAMLDDFTSNRLARFGTFEDAMWSDEPFLFHSRLSAALNTKLLNPRECVEAVIRAYDSARATINNVEGFVRQVLGWREYIRGIYWLHMPGYAEMNFMGHQLDVPSFFWDGDTEMECVRQTLRHVLDHGYSHHIHRLMVLGNLALLLGVHPRKFHEWHMAMYVDAVDWVSLPNTLGMSQYGDGGIVGSKPYCATGRYVDRMSNFCRRCRLDPVRSTGENACPFTTLYWDFLDRHHERLKDNLRLRFQIRSIERKRRNTGEMEQIRERAALLRQEWGTREVAEGVQRPLAA
jgi:deoxyribodipyrimidine photolyase-related protein